MISAMSKQFDLSRMGKLLRWCWVTDLPYTRKALYTNLAVFCLIFQFDNLFAVLDSREPSYMYDNLVSIVLMVVVVSAGAMMLTSYYDRMDNLRTLHMLPASNKEKFIVRYLFSLLVQAAIPIFALCVADVLQYVVAQFLLHAPARLVMASFFNFDQVNNLSTIVSRVMLLLWLHTFYLVGSNFFRNIKYCWAFPTIILVALAILLSSIGGHRHELMVYLDKHDMVLNVIFLVLSVVNVWLAYRLFAERQWIGRFINTIKLQRK